MKALREKRHGDAVAMVATPLARMLGLDCVDKATGELRKDSGCAKRQAEMNQNGKEPIDRR